MKIILWFIYLLGVLADSVVEGIVKAENHLAGMRERRELEQRMR